MQHCSSDSSKRGTKLRVRSERKGEERGSEQQEDTRRGRTPRINAACVWGRITGTSWNSEFDSKTDIRVSSEPSRRMMSLTNPSTVASGPSSVRTGNLKRSVQAAFEGKFWIFACGLVHVHHTLFLLSFPQRLPVALGCRFAPLSSPVFALSPDSSCCQSVVVRKGKPREERECRNVRVSEISSVRRNGTARIC